MPNRYITTAIDYPNAAPHMGHVLEKVLADVAARWFRLRGDSVRFQIGTDEHGIKIQQTAQKEGMKPEELVDKNVPLFEDLYARLHVSADMFIRTSDRTVSWKNVEPFQHRPTVQALWKKMQEAGVLEKRTYIGLYCSGCERFVTKKDLVDGKCPDHQKVPDEVKEENWFFVLSKEQEWLQNLLKKEYRIIPENRANETLNVLNAGLEDVSFSRPKSSLSWGIPVPGDEEQTMYVWCDALTNYISGIGYLTDREEKQWWDNATVTHVIGKDIARFHALIWPAMLKHAGVKTPNELLIHGFLTSEGQKMSKSLGNVVKPEEVLAHFHENPDPLRFYLSHEIPVGNDGDFSWDRIDELYNSKLRNQIGNLLNRVLVLLKKTGGSLRIPMHDDLEPQVTDVMPNLETSWMSYVAHMDAFMMQMPLASEAMNLVQAMNLRMEKVKPWTLSPDDQIHELSIIAEYLRHIALMLLPFIPDTAYRISKQLNVPYADRMLAKDFTLTAELKAWGGQKDWKTVGEPSILFAPLS